ncbi:MAG: hypothetical protein NZ556_07380 [Fimbriimonadales bacterium]|nr:hypothetical protein [Fimbriimonadales bacterium]
MVNGSSTEAAIAIKRILRLHTHANSPLAYLQADGVLRALERLIRACPGSTVGMLRSC